MKKTEEGRSIFHWIEFGVPTILSIIALIISSVGLARQERANNINSPLYYDVSIKKADYTQKLSDTGTTMVSSKLMFTLSFQETSGELYKAIVYEPSSYAAQTETEERDLVINAFNTTLQDFNLNNSSFVSDLDQDNLSFYFCVVKLVDTQHNATWWVVTIPIPSKTMRMEIDSNTRTVTTRIGYETLGPDSDLLNASFLTIEEALAEPLSLAEKIFDGNYRTEEQKSWARQ